MQVYTGTVTKGVSNFDFELKAAVVQSFTKIVVGVGLAAALFFKAR